MLSILQSDNDPYVSTGNGKELAKHIGVTMHVIPQAGHLNAESGWTKFPQLLEELENI